MSEVVDWPAFEPGEYKTPAALYEGVRLHNEQACEQLYHALHDRWIRHLKYVFPEECEDVFAECFIEILQSIFRGNLAEPPLLFHWTSCIISRVISKFIEKRIKRREHGELGSEFFEFVQNTWDDRAPNPEELALREEKRQANTRLFLAAFEELDAKHQEVIRRMCFQNQSSAHVEQAMNITANQVRLWKWRAIAQMKVHVEKQQQREAWEARLRKAG